MDKITKEEFARLRSERNELLRALKEAEAAMRAANLKGYAYKFAQETIARAGSRL